MPLLHHSGSWLMHALLQVRASLDRVNEVWSSKRCVIYTPTVEAGVNFDREHFHRMFVLLSGGSTHPLGVMQMTGRARKLGSHVVPCLIKNMPITDALPASPEEMVDHFMWVDGNCHPSEVNTSFTYDWVELADGGRMRLPKRDAQLLVASHNMARSENSKHCFMQQLHDLLRHAGHKTGRWELTEEEEGAGTQLTQADAEDQRAAELLAAEPITWRTAQQYMRDRDNNQATAQQKWALERYIYCNSWGIDNMAAAQHPDAFAAFMKEHGTDVEAYKLRLCTAIFHRPELVIGAQAGRGDISSETAPEKLAALLRELLHACNIGNPFSPAQKKCQLMPDVQQKLRQCTAFQSAEQYKNQVARLFGIKAGQGKKPLDFSNRGHLTRHYRQLFSKAGLAAERVTLGNRSPSKGKADVNGIPWLTFLAGPKNKSLGDTNQKMADLVKVRMARAPHRYVDELATFMGAYELKHYQQLCGPVLERLARQHQQWRGEDDEGASEGTGEGAGEGAGGA
jgi:hypothetical protein